jgi:hypothetical protein
MILQDTGIIENAALCHVITECVQLYPLLDGETTFESQTPLLYTPVLPEVMSKDELQKLRKLSEM